MGRFWYTTLRSLHLYVGLFLSPFVLLFAVSVILVNHPGIPLGAGSEPQVRNATVNIPPGLAPSKGLEQVRLSRHILDQAGVSGEIYFISPIIKPRGLSIRVTRPRYEAVVELDLATGAATIEERRTGFLESLNYLHKMPGPHLANIRGNWRGTIAWARISDVTVWLLLFLTVSGLYLWVVLRSDRLAGGVLAAAGAVPFFGMLYALCL